MATVDLPDRIEEVSKALFGEPNARQSTKDELRFGTNGSLTGAHVLIVHHSGKDRDRGMRGSNALLGAVDAAIEVTKDADTGLCEAKVTAIKDGGEVGPFA